MTDMTTRYWAYVKKSIRGPFLPKEIAQIPGFGKNTLVCPEAALGQWREAGAEPVFQGLFDLPAEAPKPVPAAAKAEDAALKSLLEKAITKNKEMENEVRAMKSDYARQRRQFEEDLSRKENEVRALAERLKKTAAAAKEATAEHPSWEMLYKELKNRTDEKLSKVTQVLGERTEEISRLRAHISELKGEHEDEKRRLKEAAAASEAKLKSELAAIRSELEEKETVADAFNGNINSLLRKNEEIQRIMLDERKDYEEKTAKFCDEIGRLKGELKWKDQQLAAIQSDLFEAVNKLKDLEASQDFKDRREEELYGVLHNKIRLLAGYFDNLENRVKYAFRKA